VPTVAPGKAVVVIAKGVGVTGEEVTRKSRTLDRWWVLMSIAETSAVSGADTSLLEI
jgi:hypothetical protein